MGSPSNALCIQSLKVNLKANKTKSLQQILLKYLKKI